MNKLEKHQANHAPLTPITFLKRAAMFYADRTSIIYGEARFTWAETYDRCRRLASSLHSLGIAKNDVVSVLAPNIPALYEMHFAVPMAGAVLNAINTRLDGNTIKIILSHSEAKLLFVDHEYIALANEAIAMLKVNNTSMLVPSIVIINEIGHPKIKVNSKLLEYEQLVVMGNLDHVQIKIEDEWDPIALNYTSGTTSSPKGVVYSHRGTYLSTLSIILAWEVGTEPVYLWTLPMFHCNGWSMTWGIAARGGTNVCIRNTSASEIYRNIALHGVTHLCGAPIVLDMLREAKYNNNQNQIMPNMVQILTGGAPPPAVLLQEMDWIGFHVVHGYGLTEATGIALLCEWQKGWDRLSQEEKARLKTRQGVSVLTMPDMDVKDISTGKTVPYDGKTKGEIVVRGSGLMKGYLKDAKATAESFQNGWFHTGDVGVIHPDGYIEIKDRLKDVIISGGENISSVEVEGVIFRHSMVANVAVVAMPDPTWGESPCAFIVKKIGGENVTEQDISTHCRSNLPHYMLPKKIVFLDELPTTSTGKVRKLALREIANKFGIPNSENSYEKRKITVSRL